MQTINESIQSGLSLFRRIVTDPNESDDVGVKKMMIAGANLAMVPVGFMLTLFYYYLTEAPQILWIGTGAILWMLSIVFLFPKLHKDNYWWGNVAGTGVVVMLLSFTLAMGGFENSGYLFPLLGLSNPIVGAINLKPRDAMFWLFVHVACLFAVPFLQLYLPSYNISPTLSSLMFSIIAAVASVWYFVIFLYFIQQRDEAFRLLKVEQAKSESLLLNILPQEIALTLKNEQRLIAEHFPSASILFADVVSFTPMSATMTPTELVELLNEVFSYFDELVEKYGAEKIKTIGDCYMVASGVPRLNPNHAKVLAQLALDIRDYVDQHEFCGKRLTFRIGINSGPVVAGVIGHKKFAYDLWGDAVNTASRMESHGTGGVIQITETTYNLIRDEFVCESRGTINVKGKGEMKVWQVIGHKETIR